MQLHSEASQWLLMQDNPTAWGVTEFISSKVGVKHYTDQTEHLRLSQGIIWSGELQYY